MSIASALPLGATADNELVTIHLAGQIDPKDTLIRLNKRLPEGLKLTSAQVLHRAKDLAVEGSEFLIECGMGNAECGIDDLRAAVDELMAREEIPWVRESGGKRRVVDLRPGIAQLQIEDCGLRNEGQSVVQLKLVVEHREFTVKAFEVVAVLAERVPGLELIGIHRTRLIVG
jgi:radical SAM-linked protein